MTTNNIYFNSHIEELEKFKSLCFTRNTELNNAIKLANNAIKHAELFQKINEQKFAFQNSVINEAIKNLGSIKSSYFDVIKNLGATNHYSNTIKNLGNIYKSIPNISESIYKSTPDISESIYKNIANISNNLPNINLHAIRNATEAAKKFQKFQLEHHRMISNVSQLLPKQNIELLQTSLDNLNTSIEINIDKTISTYDEMIEKNDISQPSTESEVEITISSPPTQSNEQNIIIYFYYLLKAYILTNDFLSAIKATPENIELLNNVLKSLNESISSFLE